MLGLYPTASAPTADGGTSVAPAPAETVVGRSFAGGYDVEAFVGRSFQFSYQVQSGGEVAFTRSAARTIKVQADDRAFSAVGKFWNVQNAKQPRGLKDPNSTIDITLDWSDYMTDIGGGVPALAVWTLGGALVQVGDFLDGCFASVVFSGGAASTTPVPLTCKITTSDTPPRSDERTVYLTIEDR